MASRVLPRNTRLAPSSRPIEGQRGPASGPTVRPLRLPVAVVAMACPPGADGQAIGGRPSVAISLRGVAVSIESIKVAPAPVGTEGLILRASLAPPPRPDEHWWWLREVRRRMALRVVAASTGPGSFEIQIETSRQELEAMARRFRDALAAAISARPERYAADQQERDVEIRANRDRRARSPRSGPGHHRPCDGGLANRAMPCRLWTVRGGAIVRDNRRRSSSSGL